MNKNEEYYQTHNVKYEDEKYKNLIGLQFGKLTVRHVYHMKQKHASRLIMECICECGNITHQRIESLRKGNVTSCGCSSHGLSQTHLYFVWKNIKNRCYRRNNIGYKWYGGRGITMCDEWKENPMSFITWCMDNGYKEGLQIDRKDNNKGYYPDNCRFVTVKENMRNTSVTRRLTLNGISRPLTEWSEILGIAPSCIFARVQKGLPDEKVLLMPINKRQQRVRERDENGNLKGKKILYKGERHTCLEWAAITGLKWWTISNRLRLGWDVEKVFTTPERNRKCQERN